MEPLNLIKFGPLVLQSHPRLLQLLTHCLGKIHTPKGKEIWGSSRSATQSLIKWQGSSQAWVCFLDQTLIYIHRKRIFQRKKSSFRVNVYPYRWRRHRGIRKRPVVHRIETCCSEANTLVSYISVIRCSDSNSDVDKQHWFQSPNLKQITLNTSWENAIKRKTWKTCWIKRW